MLTRAHQWTLSCARWIQMAHSLQIKVHFNIIISYEGVSKSFRSGRLDRMKMVQLSATRCSCIAILWVSLMSFAAITTCVVSQRVIPKVSVHFVIDSVRKLLDTPSYMPWSPKWPLPFRFPDASLQFTQPGAVVSSPFYSRALSHTYCRLPSHYLHLTITISL
jgi:hypothetical protein